MVAQIFLVIGAVLLQNTTILEIYGVKPNLILVLLIALAFREKQWLRYMVLVVLASLLIKLLPGWDWQAITIAAMALGSYLIKNYLPWRPHFSNFMLIILATILFSLPQIFWGEILYNAVLGIGIYTLLKNEKT